MDERLAFCFGKDTHLPILLGFSTYLREENLRMCKSKLVFSNSDYSVVHKRIPIDNIDIFITYSEKSPFGCIRGYVYKDGKEYAISETRAYVSLQIGKYCYDNICVIKLDENIFVSENSAQSIELTV
jgi:hypothetical protein